MTDNRVPQVGEPLTSREREVLGLMADGLTNPRIAARLSVSEDTVRSHVARIMRKLGVAGRATGRLEAVIAAYRVGELRSGFPQPESVPVVVPQPGFEDLAAVAEGLLAGRPLPSVRREALVALTAAGRRGPGGRPLPADARVSS